MNEGIPSGAIAPLIPAGITAWLNSLLKKAGFREGHGFSRAVNHLKKCGALAPEEWFFFLDSTFSASCEAVPSYDPDIVFA